MAAGGVAARHVRIGDGDDLLAEERADPADGSHEGLVLAPPALAAVVGPLDGADGLLAQGREQLERGHRRDRALGEDVLVAVGVGASHEGVGRRAVLACEALRRLRGIAVGIEGDLCLGATHDLVDLLGGSRAVADDDGEATRGGERAQLPMGEAGVVQALGHELAQLLLGLHERRGRHLLAADLEQKVPGVCHGLRPPPPWSSRPCRQRARGRPHSTPWRPCGRAGCSLHARSPRWRRARRGC